MDKPLVSVIIPCYNAERFVEQAIRSIMEQTYKNLEIIVCDDCSTDGTYQILEKLASEDKRVVLLRNEQNLQIVATLNKMIEFAKGKYIARMDADDISLPTRIEKQVEFLEDNPEFDFCGCNAFHINESGKVVGNSTLPESYDDIKFFLPYYSTFYHPTVLARAEVIKQNHFDEDFIYAEDYELWCRLVFEKKMKGANLEDRLLEYRINTQGISISNLKKQKRVCARIIKKYKPCFSYLNFIKLPLKKFKYTKTIYKNVLYKILKMVR